MKKAALYLCFAVTVLAIFSCQKDNLLEDTESKACCLARIDSIMPGENAYNRIVYKQYAGR